MLERTVKTFVGSCAAKRLIIVSLSSQACPYVNSRAILLCLAIDLISGPPSSQAYNIFIPILIISLSL